MKYSILAVGLSDELLSNLKKMVAQYKLHFVASPAIQEAIRLVYYQVFHLIIADLEYLRSIHQVDCLAGIRRNTFAPIILLSDSPERDMNRMIQIGVDMCILIKWPCLVIADLAYAQLRRYIECNHYNNPGEAAMEGSYSRGVSGPVALLRKAIEPDITNPRYIETIPRIGYRFTAYCDETCDDCSSSVGLAL